MAALAVGSQVWVFDRNHRIYKQGKFGPDFRSHFVPRTITSETSRSWVLSSGEKIPKATLKGIYTSERQIDDACYVNDNRYRISQAVYRMDCAAVLREIAVICGISA